MYRVYFSIVFLSCFSSCADEGYKVKKIGDKFVQSKFIGDSIINGMSVFLDSAGGIESKGFYKMGIKDGITTTYYKNKKINEILKYSNGIINGTAEKFDTIGNLKFKANNFFGIKLGDYSSFEKGKIVEYAFYNFEHKQLINCRYDSSEHCNYFMFNAKPILNQFYSNNNDSAYYMFLYFPKVPDFEAVYIVGEIDSTGKIKRKYNLVSDKVFLDTILPSLDAKREYFISIQYKNISHDSTFTVHYERF